MATDSDFQFPMAVLVFQPSGIIIIAPTPTIRDITPIVLIWDGAVIRGIIIATITSIGIIIGQAIITKATSMAINEAINSAATVTSVETTIVDTITTDASGGDKSIIM